MAFAAAAVVGTKRGINRGLNRFDDHASNARCSITFAAGMSVTLIVIGVVMLVKGAYNERRAQVTDYDRHVESWTNFARAQFAALALNMTTRNSSANVSQPLVASTHRERRFPDAEHGQGLDAYVPLRYEAAVEFPSYYPTAEAGQPNAIDWSILPTRDDAEQATFEFTLASNGSASTFQTPAVPLVYDQVARGVQVEKQCRRRAGHLWRGRQCHVVSRLRRVCVQVGADEDGRWLPYRHTVAQPPSRRPGETAPATPPETYGCQQQRGWNPIVYEVDTCWGSRVTQACPAEDRGSFTVAVIIRSAADPFLRAEELTNDSLNFGLSRTTFLAYGITLLVIGIFLAIIPTAKLWKYMCKPAPEENRSLRYQCDAAPEPAADVGIYGNRMI